MNMRLLIATAILSAAAATAAADPTPGAGDTSGWQGVVARIGSEEELDRLVEAGVRVVRRRDDLALLYIPPGYGARMAPGEPAPRIRRPGPRPTMDIAMLRYDADKVTRGDGTYPPYTGKGVVTGICDIGLDPLHDAFYTADGECRLRRVVQYLENAGERRVITPDGYADWGTDTTGEYHATHVAGILAGGCDAAGYGGVAGGSDLVVALCQESEMALLAGVEDILDYARETGRPAVVNLSMGSYLGPHDGTSLFSQYMDKLGREAIICLSSGNEGKHLNSLAFDFTADDPDVAVKLRDRDWAQFNMYGAVEGWSADSRPVSLRLVINDGNDNTAAATFPELTPVAGETWTVSSYPWSQHYDETFARYYDGWVTISGGIDDENGRYVARMEYDARTEEKHEGEAWARYELKPTFSGEPGTHVNIFSDGIYTQMMTARGNPSPNPDFSVSDLCTGHNVVSVGMYGNRATAPLLAGGEEETGFDDGGVVVHSSYGTLLDGRVLPLTVAPGAPIIAPCSTPWLEANPAEMAHVSALTRESGHDSYWIAQSGTSMSSPYVAGFIATWVEADPSLTIDDVKDIIAVTNRRDIPDPENPRHGGGWFDPYRGLLEVIRRKASVNEASACSDITMRYVGGSLVVDNPGQAPLRVAVYSVDGHKVLDERSDTPSASYGLTSLTPGVYVATAGTRQLKFIIRQP